MTDDGKRKGKETKGWQGNRKGNGNGNGKGKAIVTQSVGGEISPSGGTATGSKWNRTLRANWCGYI